jgi:hypothetical protein
MLIQVIAIGVVGAALALQVAQNLKLRVQVATQAAELARLREQNAVMEQLTADAAAQATLDSEASADLLAHLQEMRAENAALKGRQ